MAEEVHKVNLKIKGMHCASCEVLIERKFREVDGVEKVNVNQSAGTAELYCTKEPDIKELEAKIKEHGYTIVTGNEKVNTTSYIEIGAIFAIIFGIYTILKYFNLLPNIGIKENMSYGFIFLIGIVAALSTCLAITGGLLLSIAAKYNEKNKDDVSGIQKFKPHIYFNIGRIMSYTLLGGVVGALGSILVLSPALNGVLTIFASTAMILVGLQLLNIFPQLNKLQFKMPKIFAHKLYDANKASRTAPLLFGASTFFLPCGFTQALQLYVLSTGDAVKGALTMMFFSLGTMPALVSLGAVSSFSKGAIQNYFLKFAGALVIILGLFSINNGVTLVSTTVDFGGIFEKKADFSADPNVKLIDGKQYVFMKVTGLAYTPLQFTVKKGVPVVWEIDGTGAQGCAQVLLAPKLGIREYLPRTGPKTFTFTPTAEGKIKFSCAMGMAGNGLGAFNVVSA